MKKLSKCLTVIFLGFISVFAALSSLVVAVFVQMRIRFALMLEESKSGHKTGAKAGEEPPRGDMAEIVERLKGIPFEPTKPEALGVARGVLCSSFLPLLNTVRATAGRIYPYPVEFEEVVFESLDGTPLVGIVGIHPDGEKRPGLVVSHGFMGSKNDHYVIDVALKAYAGWGFNVMALDLRNFGRSQELSHSPTTAGWKEGEDILSAARYLHETGAVTTVGATGFSMGAGAVVRASYMARDYPYITGGAIAWNGYSDSERMVKYIGTRPPSDNPFFPVYIIFRVMHYLRRLDMRTYITDPEVREHLYKPFKEADFTAYVEKIAAPHYGVEVDDFYRFSSCVNYLEYIEIPLLIVHSTDDPVCPPLEMEPLVEIAEKKPNVFVWMLPAGNHCMFRYFDENWYDTVMREFFEYWASVGQRG